MTVKEVKQALGSWELYLRPWTPREIIDKIQANPFGHIAIVPGRVNPAEYGDGLLSQARFVGVFRAFFNQPDDHYEIKGCSMAFWLGDEDEKGDVFEQPVSFVNETFANTIRGLLPPNGSVTEGTIHSVPGGQTYTGKHVFQTPRKAITYVTDTFSNSNVTVEWRVNGDATLDAGPIENLYVTDPKAILIEKETGREVGLTGLRATLSNDYDVEDYTTRVVLLGEETAIGEADGPATSYKDLHGNNVVMTRLVSESSTSETNADIRAAIELNKYAQPRRASQISSDEFDIKGEFEVGDFVWVFDPDGGFVDTNNEIYWKGVPINPMKLRVVEMTWPIRAGWTVAFRTHNGEWIDLSEYYRAESGATYIVVGEFLRTLAGGNREPLTSRPIPDTSVPAAPTFGDFSTGSYIPSNSEWVKAAILVTWNEPLNQDGSTITDGDHYEIRYRVNTFIGYAVKWGTLSGFTEVLTENFSTPVASGWPVGWTRVGGTDADFEVTNGKGLMTPSATNSERAQVRTAITDADARVGARVSINEVATGGPIYGGVVLRRAGDGSSHLRADLVFNTDETVDLQLVRVGGDGNATLGTVTLAGEYTADREYQVEIQAVGTQIKARAWDALLDMPNDWQIEVEEDSVTSGHVGVRSILDSSNTNSSPAIAFDDIRVVELNSTGGFKWGELESNRWGAPISDPIESSDEWHTIYVGWDQDQFMVQELTPGVEYEFQIRAVDAVGHQGPFSPSKFVLASGDLFAPSTPAAPTVAGSLIAIKVTHTLGRATGGTFNLEPDLSHLDVHVGTEPAFTPTENTLVGKLPANAGLLRARIPAIATFEVEQTGPIWVKVVAVDSSGNKSNPSEAAQVTAELIDNAHISDLSVSKVTAGSILANWILSASIKTAESGARVELAADGIHAYNDAGVETLLVDSSTGDVNIRGRFETVGEAGAVISLEPTEGEDDPYLRLIPNNAFGRNRRGHLSAFVGPAGLITALSTVRLNPDSQVQGGRLWLGEYFSSWGVEVTPWIQDGGGLEFTDSWGWAAVAGGANTPVDWEIELGDADHYAKNNGTMKLTQETTNDRHLIALPDLGSTDTWGWMDFNWNVGSATGAEITTEFWVRYTDPSNGYRIRLLLNGTAVSMSLLKSVNPTVITLATAVPVGTQDATLPWWRVKWAFRNNRLMCKAWRRDRDIEPSTWHISITHSDSSIDSGRGFAVQNRMETGNTNNKPHTFEFDNLNVFRGEDAPAHAEFRMSTFNLETANGAYHFSGNRAGTQIISRDGNNEYRLQSNNLGINLISKSPDTTFVDCYFQMTPSQIDINHVSANTRLRMDGAGFHLNSGAIQLNIDNNTFDYKGKFHDFVAATSDQGIFTGAVTIPAGFSNSGSLLFGATMAGKMAVIGTLTDTGGPVAWNTDVISATGFQFKWAGTGGHRCDFMAIRVG